MNDNQISVLHITDRQLAVMQYQISFTTLCLQLDAKIEFIDDLYAKYYMSFIAPNYLSSIINSMRNDIHSFKIGL